MTSGENERLARVETRLDGLGEDVGEMKTTLVAIHDQLKVMNQRGNDRHAEIEARLAVLEKDSSRFEKFLWGAAGAGGGSVAMHAYNFINGGLGG